jgi:hypothetical protein
VEENWRESKHFVDSLDWRKQLEDMAHAAEDKADAKKDPVEKTARKRIR